MGQPCVKTTKRTPGPSTVPKLSREWILPFIVSIFLFIIDIVPVTIQVYYLRGKKANAEKIFRDKIFLDRLSDRGKYIILLGIATRQETAAG